MSLPASYLNAWSAEHRARFADYADGRTSFVVGLAPELAVTLPAHQLFSHLRPRLGNELLRRCLDPTYVHPSPVADERSGDWLRTTGTVGVNVRTIGSFLEVVKYALTLPDHVRGVHLLPIWEPGVVGSLYGMASWELNPEFYSRELYAHSPALHRLDNQLKVVVNLLHAMGKVVGMDVIPHTDRYSEMVLANPDHFEWVRRHGTSIVSQRDWLHEEVQGAITDWLAARGPALPAYGLVGGLWQLREEDRLRIFFGHPNDYGGRQARRVDLVGWLFHRGLEPVPATMAPPYRGLEVDPNPEAVTVDEAGRVWRDYRITQPTEMSRAFGPLTRYKLYGRRDDNRDWAINFDQPRRWVWDYLTGHYADQQSRFNFDFMRGDMSHVQMRPDGVPAKVDNFYDPLRAVKRRIQRTAPHFAYFAESFLERPDFMAFGDEVEHLERSEAEVTLGNLQSLIPDSDEFWRAVDHYLNVESTSAVTPAWTVITGDKDDPRFDHFHHWAELARVFTGLFLGKLPLYYSLGFEQRDRHLARAANEVYSKLYVFQETRGDKAVSGPYVWGDNLELFGELTRLHVFAAGLPRLGETTMLDAGAGADATKPRKAKKSEKSRVLAWSRTAEKHRYLFVVSFAREEQARVSVAVVADTATVVYASDEANRPTVAVADGTVVLDKLHGACCLLIAAHPV